MGGQAGLERQGFGKRGAVRLPPARKPVAEVQSGEHGDAPVPSDFDAPSSSAKASLKRQGWIAAGMLLIGLPLAAGLFSSFFRQSPNEQSGANGASRLPVIIPGIGGGGGAGQQTVTRGGFGSSGAHIGSGG